jgi:hypothetical protein
MRRSAAWDASFRWHDEDRLNDARAQARFDMGPFCGMAWQLCLA